MSIILSVVFDCNADLCRKKHMGTARITNTSLNIETIAGFPSNSDADLLVCNNIRKN